jgi:hypothetical protein
LYGYFGDELTYTYQLTNLDAKRATPADWFIIAGTQTDRSVLQRFYDDLSNLITLSGEPYLRRTNSHSINNEFLTFNCTLKNDDVNNTFINLKINSELTDKINPGRYEYNCIINLNVSRCFTNI